LLAAIAVAACGGGNNGTPSGGSSPNYCSTGTQLVLFDPLPGSQVLSSTRSIYVASYYPIVTQASLAAVLQGSRFSADDPAFTLQGPVGAPTPTPFPSTGPSATPTPFPTPPFGTNSVYYEATGFHLKPSRRYTVWIAIKGSGCVPHALRGAFFSTQRKF